MQITFDDIAKATKDLWEKSKATYNQDFTQKWAKSVRISVSGALYPSVASFRGHAHIRVQRYACDSSGRHRAHVKCWNEFNRARLPFTDDAKLSDEHCRTVAIRVFLQPGELVPTRAELKQVQAAWDDWCNPRMKAHIEQELRDSYMPRTKGPKPEDQRKKKGRKHKLSALCDEDEDPDEELNDTSSCNKHTIDHDDVNDVRDDAVVGSGTVAK